MNTILLLKTIHIIGFTAWFAGLFYLVRIFVYHAESKDKPQPDRDILIDQFTIMENRVYKIICNPGMMITWTCGIGMIYLYGMDWFKLNYWLHIKLVLLILLTVYHLYNKKLMQRLQDGSCTWTSYKFRMWNEVPTLFLVAIVVLAVFRNGTDWVKAFVSIFAFGIVIFLLTKWYKKLRESKSTNS